jgi:tetratricopeptide (TPR) repeat protein
MKQLRFLLPGIILILGFNPSLIAQVNLTELYYLGDYREVIRQTSALIESGDTAFNTYYLQVLSEAQLGQTAEAIRTLELGLESHPGDIRMIRMLAGQQFDAGYYIEARRNYTFLVEKDSTDVSSWLKLADIASFRQHNKQALEALNQVLHIDSMNLSGLMKMGDILNRHNSSGAIVFYRKAYLFYPNNQNAAYALGNLNIQAREAWKNIPICEHMLSRDTSSIKFSKLLGYSYYKMGEPENGALYFEYANQLGDSTTFSFKFKGICHYLRVDFESAIQSLQIAAAKDSLDAEIFFFLGASMATTKEKGEAMAHLNKSLRLMQPDPKISSRIYSEQGNLKRLEEEYEQAYSLYEQAWEADSTNVASLYFMASILDNSMHKSKEALLDYQHYIDVLDRLPEKKQSSQTISIRTIVEDRIVSLKEELFFRDED